MTAAISPRLTRSHVEIPLSGHGPGAHSNAASRATVRLHGDDRPGNAEVTRSKLLVPGVSSN